MIHRIVCFIVFLGLFYFVRGIVKEMPKRGISLNGSCTPGDSCVSITMECSNFKCRCKFMYHEINGQTDCERYGTKSFTKMRISDSNISSIDILKLWEARGVSCGGESEMFRNGQIDFIDRRCIVQAYIFDRAAYQVEIVLSTDNFTYSSTFCASTYVSINNFDRYGADLKCFTNKDGFQLLYTSSDETKFYFGIYSSSERGITKLFYADHENVSMDPASVIAEGNGISTLDSINFEVRIYDSPACQYTPSVNAPKCPMENGPPVIISNQASHMEVRIKSSVSIECKYLSMTSITQLDWWFIGHGEAKLMIKNSAKYSQQEDVLTVYDFSVNDQGSYYCNVSNLFSSASSADMKINLTEVFIATTRPSNNLYFSYKNDTSLFPKQISSVLRCSLLQCAYACLRDLQCHYICYDETHRDCSTCFMYSSTNNTSTHPQNHNLFKVKN